MADRVISNPIINSPYRAPFRHFAFDNDGITDRIVEGRRGSSYFVPVPRPRKRGAQQQLELGELTADQIEKNQFVNEIRARVGRWREAGHPDVTAVTRRLLEYWTDPNRDNPVLFCQLEAAETAIYLAEVAQKAGDTWIRNELERQNGAHNARLNRIGLKMATGTGKTVVMANSPVQIVDVILAGPQLHHMSGEPLLMDVSLEGLPPASRVASAALRDLGLLSLPGLVGFLPAGERARRALPPTDVPVVGGVPGLAVPVGSDPGVPHQLPLIV